MNKLIDGVLVALTQQEIDDASAERAAGFPHRKSAAIASVTSECDSLIRTVVGEREGEYVDAEQDAFSHAQGGHQGPPPESVKSLMDAKAWTAQQATAHIAATAAGWRAARLSLRRARLEAKSAMTAAQSDAELAVATQSWRATFGAIRAALEGAGG